MVWRPALRAIFLEPHAHSSDTVKRAHTNLHSPLS